MFSSRLDISRKGLEVAKFHINGSKLTRDFQSHVKESAAQICKLIGSATKHSLLRAGRIDSVRKFFTSLGEESKSAVQLHVEFLLRRVASEASLLELFHLCSVVKPELFNRSIQRMKSFPDRVNLLRHGKLAPAASLLQDESPCATIDYLMYLHLAGKEFGELQLVTLENACLTWLWQVVDVPKLLCFPKGLLEQFESAAMQRKQQSFRGHSDACVLLLEKASHGKQKEQPSARLLVLMLLLILADTACHDGLFSQQCFEMLLSRAVSSAAFVVPSASIVRVTRGGKGAVVDFGGACATCSTLLQQCGESLHKGAQVRKKAPRKVDAQVVDSSLVLSTAQTSKLAKWLQEAARPYVQTLVTQTQPPAKKDPHLQTFIAHCHVSKADGVKLAKTFPTLGWRSTEGQARTDEEARAVKTWQADG